jgi:hypothetical protein
MTSADTIGCRLALAREEDGNREMRRQETSLWLGDQLQAFDHPKIGFSPLSHSDTLVLPY